jgi:hypothetical protein
MYIITNKSVCLSARSLAKKIVALGGPKLPVKITPIKDKVAIRWGSSQMILGEDTKLNDPVIIRTVANKYILSTILMRQDFPHVEILSGTPDHFPVVVRQELTGSKGAGIVVCRNQTEFNPYRRFMWSRWYNFSFELGIHILGGYIVKVFKKIWRGEGSEPEFPIKNADKGYDFSLCKIDSFKKIPDFIKTLYEIIPIQFGRLDIGWDADDRSYRLIEANSAPGLTENDNTLNIYAEFLMKGI